MNAIALVLIQAYQIRFEIQNVEHNGQLSQITITPIKITIKKNLL